MEKEILVAMIAAAGALAGAGLGSLSTWLVHRGTWRYARQEVQIARLKEEMCARMALEEEATVWIAELARTSSTAAKIQLRDRTSSKWDRRPSMRPSEINCDLKRK